MVKKTNLKCKNCGGDLEFSPVLNSLICNNCKSEQKINSNLNYEKLDYKNIDETLSNDKKTTNCVNCGAELDLNPREITKICPYCNSKFVLEKEEMIGLKPNGIIPFKFNKEQAIEHYKIGVKKKHFLPNKFKKSPAVGNINGTYIPCFSFFCDTKSSYNGRLSYDETYTDSQGNSHTQTYYKNISGTKDMKFENIIVESGEQTSQYYFEQIEPYNYDEVYAYNSDFLRGYNVESYNTPLTKCKVISNSIIEQRIKNAILSRYTYDRVVYFNLSTNYFNEKFSYLLLPVYFMNFTYKDKNYTTYINGQTGKIGNNLPQSKIKKFFAIFLPILLFAAIFLTVYLLSK